MKSLSQGMSLWMLNKTCGSFFCFQENGIFYFFCPLKCKELHSASSLFHAVHISCTIYSHRKRGKVNNGHIASI